ncbi:MAG: XRE family transcriptional regulator [Lentisphaeria bacterium]|nr:XRE family transcriptional regulator [Lentisphaeria bacterium]
MEGMNLLEISQTIRRVRLAQNMTVEQLAKKSGFSKGFISQVENFRQSPSLKALVRITEALGLPMSALFTGDKAGPPPYTLGRIDAGEEVERDEGGKYGIRYFALAYQQIGRRMDPFIIEYTPASPREFMSHEMEEFFVLLDGELDYIICDDDRRFRMKRGDTLYLRSGIPHRVELAPGCAFARGMAVYTDPKLQ